MFVQPHRTTSAKSLCSQHYSSSSELSIPLNSLSPSSSDSPSSSCVTSPSSSSSTVRHHLLLNHCFRIQNNHKGLYTRVLQPYTCTFCFDICFFSSSSQSTLQGFWGLVSDSSNEFRCSHPLFSICDCLGLSDLNVVIVKCARAICIFKVFCDGGSMCGSGIAFFFRNTSYLASLIEMEYFYHRFCR